jgi:hypothetical protein
MSVPLPDFAVNLDEFRINCAQAGLVTVNAQALMSSAVVGAALKQLGCIKVGRSKLMVADEKLDKIFQLAEGLVSRKLDLDLPVDVQQPETTQDDKVKLLQVMVMVAKYQSANAARLIESAAMDSSDGHTKTGGAPSFLPGKAVFPNERVEITLPK